MDSVSTLMSLKINSCIPPVSYNHAMHPYQPIPFHPTPNHHLSREDNYLKTMNLCAF
ncbi:hypothetical protein BofuT4_P037380.1 [Botrytis cinerea T4]|uniref:Uncharacterized protein n=1 Tax=Botryotinia fuckeliana (strain T4) TaxID=999810 RepID=G2Y518_BOTF4|nr:hypothetical protein BofuT4_P037380.1 [Botrytis cinerea T4]